MEELPFGYTHRQKRSHAQMDGQEGSASPAWASTWTSNRFSNAGEPPSAPFHSLYRNYSPGYDDRRTPAFDPAPRFSTIYEAANPTYDMPTERPTSPSQNAPRLHLPRIPNMASSAPRRFAGDGLDYRRPVGSAREQDVASVDLTGEEDIAIDLSQDEDVIDLTADDSGYGASQEGNGAGPESNDEEGQHQPTRSRHAIDRMPGLPRGMDIIIDLDNGGEEWRLATPPAPEPGSPEIEFISSRRIDPPRRPPAPLARSHSDGDEVEFVRENALPRDEVRRRRNHELDNVINAMDLIGTMNGSFTHLRAQVDAFNAQINRTANRFRQRPVAPPRGGPQAHAQIRVGAFRAPTLDFDMVAFDMGLPGGRAAEPPPPTYEAPEKAPEGFTRSPEETDVLVCPNCADELCVGGDDIKKQVWIVKSCGHVYCGECTANRSAKRSAKGKERPANTKPFKECQVDSCGKSVANRKAMIQIFM